MSEVKQPEPVDNSHLDAGVAAREAQKQAEKATVVEQAVEAAEEVVEEAEQGESQNEPEESAYSDQGGAQDQPAKPKNRGVGKRIDELTKEKYDAQRERDYWREQAMAQTRQGQPQQAQPVQAALDSDEPTLESCNFDVTEFNRAHYQWMRNEERKQEQAVARQRKFVESEAAFRAEHPDYDVLVRDPMLPITQPMAEEIADTDNPPAVAYYLAQNPQEAAAIAQMTERAMSRAIGRIEARLSAQATSAPVQPRQPEPKTVTRAPAPVTTLSGAPAVQKSYADMSQREYEAERRKERAARGLD